jgi:hypothetical protein
MHAPEPVESDVGAHDRIGRYRLVRPLSKGGMALVYEGRRESLAGVSPRVAIKFILPEHAASETFRELFINEARLGASMHHQNLVQILDFDADEDRWFLVMEYVEGLTLRKLITAAQRCGEPIAPAVIAELGRQACDGLHYAHTARDDRGRHLQLVHRDIKPSNLILTPHGIVKVLDFGISKGRLRQEKEGSVKGTWGYMAPEQAQGLAVGPASDVFGLATVLFELASLASMFGDKGRDDIKRLLRDDHAARMAATLDAAYQRLVPVLIRALQRDPRARFSSAEEFGKALAASFPDPMPARDELLRFYERAALVDAGRIPPPLRRGPVLPAEDPGTTAAARSPSRLRTLGAAFATTLLAGGLALGAAAAWALLPEPGADESTERPPPVGTPARAAFERMSAGPVLAGVTPPPAPIEPPAVVRVNRTATGEAMVTLPGEPREADEPTAAGPPEIPVDPKDMGTLVVDAGQPAEVYVGGRFAGVAPVEKKLAPGYYAVSIVSRDGRTRTFGVDLEKAGRIRKVWDFDRQEWR